MRPISTLLLVVWLLGIIIESLRLSLLSAALIAAVGLVVLYVLRRRPAQVVPRAPASSGPSGRWLSVELLPPPERYGARAPVRLTVLSRLLEDADLGAVLGHEDGVEVRSASGLRTVIKVADPEQVTLAGLRVESTSSEHALLCCDALVPRIGPVTFRANGVELFVDGTLPRVQLERQLWELQVDRRRQLRREADEAEESRGRHYVN